MFRTRFQAGAIGQLKRGPNFCGRSIVSHVSLDMEDLHECGHERSGYCTADVAQPPIDTLLDRRWDWVYYC